MCASLHDGPDRGLLVQDVEVVTVTDTSVVITWFSGSATELDRYGFPRPVATDTELLLGEPGKPDTLRAVLHDTRRTADHHAEVTGLEPGRTYAFSARSAGRTAVQTSLQFPGSGGSGDPPGVFTTLRPPPGSHLFTLALANDTHIGETTSGIIDGDFPPAFQQDEGLPPYPEVMLAAMLDDLRMPDRRADRLLVAGDLTAEAAPADVATVRRLLDRFGRLGSDYFVTRGNHDRPHAGAAWSACGAVPGGPDGDHHDCFGDGFSRPRQQLFSAEIGKLRMIGLDTTMPDLPGGTLDDGQLGDLAALLRDEPERPTLVFGHHPVTFEAAVTTAAGPTFDLDQERARQLEALYAAAPGVLLHHSGHTHRNKRTFAPGRRDVEFLEVAATKEYPGGYSLLRVHSGGYQVSFYKTRGDLARRWSQRTRGEYLGLYPAYTLGTIADRNHTVTRDLSGLTRL